MSSTSYCRLCAEQKPKKMLKDLTTDINARESCLMKLAIFSAISVDFDNKSLPETVCDDCYTNLEICYEFYLKVQQSQDVLCEICCDRKTVDIKFEEAVLDESSNCFKEDVECYSDASDAVVESWSRCGCVCAQCGAVHVSPHALREHAKTEHGTCLALRCAHCHRRATSLRDFAAHAATHCPQLRKYCEICDIKMEDSSHREIHLKQHHCTFCGEVFEEEALLVLHLSLYMSEEGGVGRWAQYPCVCGVCGARAAGRAALALHCARQHRRCFALRCADCPHVHDTFHDFVQHVHGHRPDLIPICPYCDKDMGGYDLSHINSHQSSGHTCNICGEIFHHHRHLKRHRANLDPFTKKPPIKRRRGPITDKDLTCEICGKLMKTTMSLKAHKKRHTQRNKEYTCETCGKSFYTKGSLVSHTYIHTNATLETCKICNKTFKTLNRLRKHVVTHNIERPYQCDHCKRFFSSKDRMREHVKSHMNIMPFRCSFCNKQFRHKSIMNTHLNQHTGARPYSCDTCGMDFSNWSNCNKHMKRKHGTTLAKNVMTPHGKLALDPDTGKPQEIAIDNTVKAWSQEVLLINRKSKVKK